MTTEEKFNAAVNVIKSLPKDGAYQPSSDLKLKFYSYFKQATEGPCTTKRPAVWDFIGKAKWDAWHKLGNMSKEDAMNNYVEELKKIVETMSYNANVEKFLGSLGNFYDSVPAEDIELLLGPVIERIRSQPGSPLKGSPLCSPPDSREISPMRLPKKVINANSYSLETSPVSSMTPSPLPPETEDDDEEFIDTVETIPSSVRKNHRSSNNSPIMPRRQADGKDSIPSKSSTAEKNLPNASQTCDDKVSYNKGKCSGNIGQSTEPAQTNGSKFSPPSADNCTRFNQAKRQREKEANKRKVAKQNGTVKSPGTSEDVSEPIREAILQMQRDFDRISASVRSLEATVLSQSQNQVEKKNWWPFPEFSPRTTVFVIVWPLVAHFVFQYIQRTRNRQYHVGDKGDMSLVISTVLCHSDMCRVKIALHENMDSSACIKTIRKMPPPSHNLLLYFYDVH